MEYQLEIQKPLIQQKKTSMKEYSRVDLLRFHKFANENKDLKPLDLLKQYDLKVPRLAEKEKMKNLLKAIGLMATEEESKLIAVCPDCGSDTVRISKHYNKSLCCDCDYQWKWKSSSENV